MSEVKGCEGDGWVMNDGVGDGGGGAEGVRWSELGVIWTS